MPIPETDSRPVNDPLTIRLEGCTGWRGTVLELEGTVKRWDEARAEAERLEALIRRYGCKPVLPHGIRAAGGLIWVSVRFRCSDVYKELLVKLTVG
jgi:hypothetical protein